MTNPTPRELEILAETIANTEAMKAAWKEIDQQNQTTQQQQQDQ